jgi:signal transduction histidine kinase
MEGLVGRSSIKFLYQDLMVSAMAGGRLEQGRMAHSLEKISQRVLQRALPTGIQQRLYLLIGLALLPVLLLIGWIYYQRYDTRRAYELQTQVEVAQGVATTFTAYLEGVRQQNHAVGQSILALSPYPEEEATRLLTTAAAGYPTIRNLNWVSPDGIVLASSQPSMVGRDLSIRSYFQQILAGRPWAAGDLTITGVATDTPTAAFATAIRDHNGILSGVVVAGIEPTRLGELTLTQQRPSGGTYAIFDGQGVLVYRSPETPFSWEDRVRWRESDAVLRRALETGQPQVNLTRLEVPGGEWFSARVPVAGSSWIAGASRPVEVALAPVRQGLLMDGLLTMLVFAMALLLASLVAQNIASPLHRLEQDAQAMGAGEARTRCDPLAPTEVRRLRSTVEGMAQGLIQRAEALREAHEQAVWLARFPNENPNPVARVSAAGCILYCNPAAEKLPGWNCRVGQSIFDPLLPLIQQALVHGEEVQHDILLADRFYSISVMPFPAEAYTNIYGRDITERKQAEEALQQRRLELERSNRHLQEFAFIASHDLQEPLRKIEIIGDAVLQNTAGLDERQRDRLARLRAAASRMRCLLEGLLQYSLSTAQGQVYEPVALDKTVAEVLASLELEILEEQGIVEVGSLPVVEADPVQMRQVLRHLISNALKFHKPGVPPVVRVWCDATTSDWGAATGHSTLVSSPQSLVAIVIEDNGIGFNDRHASRLFQPFQRLVGRSDKGELEFPGSGIGLAICRRIVESHGGQITAQGINGQGAKFILMLPVKALQPKDKTAPIQHTAPEIYPINNQKVE